MIFGLYKIDANCDIAYNGTCISSIVALCCKHEAWKLSKRGDLEFKLFSWDINIPALIIRKYVARKLDLPSEAKVEIMFQGYPVIPTLQLRHLIDLWLQTRPTPSERIQTYMGSSAKDFVMELNYARKAAVAGNNLNVTLRLSMQRVIIAEVMFGWQIDQANRGTMKNFNSK
ncbi:hypothetical protein Nepgr_002493 [Nepenthes gracilis]|uniref:Uncharacterized protein n=1 Tax=Nepenthes gracilis TaxID=150966 RepID=A0AAD3P9Q1_NEPGR|nr:hypothetical protein Nepgr_002493 [Nepenthes gracilis]